MGSHPINLAVRFLLELAALAALAVWGWNQGEAAWRYPLAISIPLICAIIWGTFAVPEDPSRSGKAPVPVPGILRLFLELVVFGSGTLALYNLGYINLSWIMGILVGIHYLVSYDRISWLLKRKNKLFELEILQGSYSLHKLGSGSEIPEISDGFYSVTRTSDEISIVCKDESYVDSISCSKGWKGFKVAGTLELDGVGILHDLTLPLKNAGIPVYAISTYNTDYLFVPGNSYKDAIKAMSEDFMVKQE